MSTWLSIVSVIALVASAIYLLIVILKPEKF